MAYDMVSRDQSRHSTLEDASSAARHQLGEGLLSHKLALGIPAYGRHMQRPGEVKTFAEIYDELRPLQHPHRSHKHAHFDNDITESGYFFNGPSTVRAKANWANDQGFAGVVIWELGQDKLAAKDHAKQPKERRLQRRVIEVDLARHQPSVRRRVGEQMEVRAGAP